MILIAAIVALLATPSADGSAPARPSTVPVRISHGITIWPKNSLSHITLCSRAPPVAARTWTPQWRDIVRVERILPTAIGEWRVRTQDRYVVTFGQFEQADWESRWSRNYFGIVRDGRRHLYIDFAPRPMPNGFSVCDGGSSFFGVEIDIGSGKVIALDVNAVA